MPSVRDLSQKTFQRSRKNRALAAGFPINPLATPCTPDHFEPLADRPEPARQERIPAQTSKIISHFYHDGARARSAPKVLNFGENRVLKRPAWQMSHDEIRDPERLTAGEIVEQPPGKQAVNVAALILDGGQATGTAWQFGMRPNVVHPNLKVDERVRKLHQRKRAACHFRSQRISPEHRLLSK